MSGDGELDLEGSITLFGRLAELMTGGREEVEIPIARVRGTTADPKVAMGPDARDLFTSLLVSRSTEAAAMGVSPGRTPTPTR